jgi:hypothetical protein
MESEPARCPPALAATVNPTVPLPVPEDPEVILIHEALLVAIQPQLPVEVTLTVLLLPEAEKFCDVGLMLKEWMPSVAGLEVALPQAFEMTTS